MKEYFNLNFMPSKSIRWVDGEWSIASAASAPSRSNLTTASVQKAVAVCTTPDSSMPATFDWSFFNVPPTGGAFNMSGFELNFTRVGGTLTLSARRLSPQTGPVEFRYGNNIYMLTSTVSSSTDPKTVPTLGSLWKAWLVGAAAATWAYLIHKNQSSENMTRRSFFRATGTSVIAGLATWAVITSQDAGAATITINSDATGKYVIADLPVSLGGAVKLSTPTVNKLDLSAWEDLTGKATPGSQVLITEWQSVRTALVDANGNWALSGLSAGPHNITLRSTDTNQNSACIASDVSSMMTINVAAINDPMPVAPPGSPFANLGNMTVSDNGWFAPITINAGWVTDPLNRTIVYSALGLPNDANGSLAINTSTGVISGIYDALWIGGSLTPFSITVKATPQNGNNPLNKTFVLSVRNDG